MLELNYHITIGNYLFRRVVGVKVNSAWRTLGDTATIELPGLKGLLAKQTAKGGGIKAGDAVTIKLGYNGQLTTEFEGFVSMVKPNIPMVIECEDYLYKLRRVQLLTKSCPSLMQAIQLIQNKVPEVEIDDDVQDISLGTLRLDYTAATLLQKFQKDYGLACYFRGRKLFVGLPLTDFAKETASYRIRYDGPGNVIDTDLEFKTRDQVKLKIKAIGVTKKGRDVIKVEDNIGDPDGELRTLFFWDVTDRAQLERLAKAELDKAKFDGYEGGITAFGWPNVRHSDAVWFRDDLFPERAGKYFVDEVTTISGLKGYRREVKLGLRLDI